MEFYPPGQRIVSWFPIVLATLVILFAGCASEPTKKGGSETEKTNSATATSASQIEISFIRGQNQHRFLMQGSGGNAMAKCYLDNQLLRETNIEAPKYADLLKRTAELISTVQHRGNMAETTPCRTPFTVSLKTQSIIQEVSGCRSDQEGAYLGKLIRDAEFLVFSSKEQKRIP